MDTTARRTLVLRPRLLALAYVSLMFAGICISGSRVLGSTGVWTLGDWLINYRGGFVRRGLAGTVALALQHVLHVRAALLVTLFAALLYLCIFACVYWMASHVRWNVWMVAAFVSPVGIAYPFVSTSGYHKEVLFLVTLAVLLCRCLYLHRKGKQPGVQEIIALSCVCGVGVLTHELFAIYSPYLLAAFVLCAPSLRAGVKLAVLPACVTFLAMAAVTLYPGTRQTAEVVCKSLGPENRAMCAGSINYLGRTKPEAHAETLSSVDEYGYWYFMPELGLVGLVPMAMAFVRLRSASVPRWVWLVLLAGGVAAALLSALLFLYGADWGRWIEIHLFSIFLLLLYFYARFRPADTTEISVPLKARTAALLLPVVLFATCWSLPGTTNIPKAGYVSMFARVGARLLHR